MDTVGFGRSVQERREAVERNHLEYETSTVDGPATVASGKKTSSRVRQACVRCRKQKLKCDSGKPCALCLRSSTACVEYQQQPMKRIKRSVYEPSRSVHPSRPYIAPEESETPASGHETRDLEPNNAREPTRESAALDRDGRALVPASIALQTRTSTYGLVGQLLRNYDSVPDVVTVAHAIPNDSPAQSTPLAAHAGWKSIIELIAMELPPQHVTHYLLDTYVQSVHWFMLVIHEPRFRAELDNILTTGVLQPHRLPFLVLAMLVLAIGAKYASENPNSQCFPEIDWRRLHSKLITKVEEKFFHVFDETDIESVQVCVLLGSHYIYHGKPKRTFVLLGTALKAAQAIGLYRESTWRPMDAVTREVWRRVWCTLYGSDGYIAINYGRPCSIREAEWQVEMPSNMDDLATRCPNFGSLEPLDGGVYGQVTVLSYQRYKCRLYQIAVPITEGIYFYNGGTIKEVVERVKFINRRLLDWHKSVPPELRLSSFKTHHMSRKEDPALNIFRLQALTLQLTYDNIQLLLHRPLLAYSESPFRLSPSSRISGQTKQDSSTRNSNASVPELDGNANTLRTSKEQCWESAMRTSKVSEIPTALVATAHTHGAAFAAIQTFTAGVMLAIFALSDPFSARATEAKQAIGRLIQLPGKLGYRTTASDQCGAVLGDLVRLILAEEMKVLTSLDESQDGSQSASSDFNPSSHHASESGFVRPPSMRAQSTTPAATTNLLNRVCVEHDQPTETFSTSTYRTQLDTGDGAIDYIDPGPIPACPQDYPFMAAGSFNNALLSLQSYSGTALGVLNGSAQSWMWEDSFSFT